MFDANLPAKQLLDMVLWDYFVNIAPEAEVSVLFNRVEHLLVFSEYALVDNLLPVAIIGGKIFNQNRPPAEQTLQTWFILALQLPAEDPKQKGQADILALAKLITELIEELIILAKILIPDVLSDEGQLAFVELVGVCEFFQDGVHLAV